MAEELIMRAGDLRAALDGAWDDEEDDGLPRYHEPSYLVSKLTVDTRKTLIPALQEVLEAIQGWLSNAKKAE